MNKGSYPIYSTSRTAGLKDDGVMVLSSKNPPESFSAYVYCVQVKHDNNYMSWRRAIYKSG